MTPSEIEELVKENARLRKIIDLLLAKYEQDTTSSSQSEQLNGKQSVTTSLLLASEEKKQLIPSDKLDVKGKNSDLASYIIMFNRKQRLSSSILEQNNGKKTSDSSPISKDKEGITSEAVSPFFEASPANIEKLAANIKIRGSWEGRKRIAHILLHFGNGGHGANPTLRHLLGLSETGVTKLIHQLKKQGLANRVRFHQYILTPKARDWIILVLGENS